MGSRIMTVQELRGICRRGAGRVALRVSLVVSGLYLLAGCGAAVPPDERYLAPPGLPAGAGAGGPAGPQADTGHRLAASFFWRLPEKGGVVSVTGFQEVKARSDGQRPGGGVMFQFAVPRENTPLADRRGRGVFRGNRPHILPPGLSPDVR